jgi:uncharacterized coiled-coil DUF342 family protein
MDTGEKKEYQKKAEFKLGELDAKIDGLSAKAKGLEAKAREKFYQRIGKLQSQKVSVEQKFKELKNESGEAWDDIKTGFESALKDLDEGFRSAAERFK